MTRIAINCHWRIGKSTLRDFVGNRVSAHLFGFSTEHGRWRDTERGRVGPLVQVAHVVASSLPVGV